MKPMDTLPRSPADDDPDPALRPAALSARWPVRVPRPAGWLRLESGRLSTDQALKNLETMVSLLQRALEGLNGIDQLHGDALVVVNDTWHKGDKSRGPPEGIAPHVRLRLGQMDEIVRQCRFHGRGLLDGQSGVVGVGLGLTAARGVQKSTFFSHSLHVFASTMASIFYLVGRYETPIAWIDEQVGMVFLVTIFAVMVPCCLSDIVFPVLMSRSARAQCLSDGHHH